MTHKNLGAITLNMYNYDFDYVILKPSIDDYAKDGGPEEILLLCSFLP